MAKTKLKKGDAFDAGAGSVIKTQKVMTDAILVRVPENETVLLPAMGLVGKTPDIRNARLARIRAGEEPVPALIVHEDPTVKGARAIEQAEHLRRIQEQERKARFTARQTAEAEVKTLVGGDVRTGTIKEFKTNDKGRYGAIVTVLDSVDGMVHVSAIVGGAKRLETLNEGEELQYRVVRVEEVEMKKGRPGQKHLNVSLSELAACLEVGTHFGHATVVKDLGNEILLRASLDGHSITLFLPEAELHGVNRASLTKTRNQSVGVNFTHIDERGRCIVSKA